MVWLEGVKHALAPLAANCRRFDERWRAASALHGRDDLAGCWVGAWVSLATGHRGPLSCALEPLAADRWRATFRARYARVLRACYATELAGQRHQDGWAFRGSSDIGWLAGGVYEFTGEARNGRFHCHYRSRYDHGTFELKRVHRC